jgi:two-component system phosphate regulon sensor histidine kinase PhoR
MKSVFPENLFVLARLLVRRRGILWRGLLAWMIGLFILTVDTSGKFDLRFQIRPTKTFDSPLTVIKISPSDLRKYNQFLMGLELSPEAGDLTDSFYWNQNLWVDLITKLNAKKPKAIGVAFFFGAQLESQPLSTPVKAQLKRSNIFWGTNVPSGDLPYATLMALDDRRNLGSMEFTPEEDGVIRNFYPVTHKTPHLIEKLSHRRFHQIQSINFFSTQSSAPIYSLQDVITGTIPDIDIENKIILIGPEKSVNLFSTPLGVVDRTSFFSIVLENSLLDLWIKKLPLIYYQIAMALLALISVVIMTQYPQTVALVFLTWLGILITSLSVWIFDTFRIWLPTFAPLVQIAATYVIFLGHRANRIERKHWELQQEQIYHQKLEQLKNNFVSLISHDLKTPIAKIQGVLNRLQVSPELKDHTSTKKDLGLIQTYSEELNRYIHSILQLLRVESKDFEIEKTAQDFNDLVIEVVDSLKILFEQKRIDLVLQLEPMFSIECDPKLIREVILNVVENALKYTPPSGKVTLITKEVETSILFECHDTGEGIPKDEIEKVWGKFVRGKDQDLKSQGSGLGLYLAKYFIELHGGKIWISSEPKKGTLVSFSLPVQSF